MTLLDWINLAFDMLRSIPIDFSCVGLPVTITFYDLFWGSVVIEGFFIIFYSYTGGRK